MVRSRVLIVVLAAVVMAAAPIGAVAQPLDPYDAPPPPIADPGEDPRPPGGAVADERDPELDEAVAAALVRRARELMTQEAWLDAQQLLNEAIIRSAEGPAAAEARALLEQVNAKLGIVTQPGPVEPIGRVDPVDPYDSVRIDAVASRHRDDRPRAGRSFMLHAGVMGAVVGGFIGDAASADVDAEEDSGGAGGVVAGALLGGVAGLAIGATFRNSEWMTRDDIVVIDSFAAFGLVGSLSLGALMQPAEPEAYSVNGALGTLAGAVVGYRLAKTRDLSARRMGRIDLYALAGAAVPWLVFAASDGDEDGAQVAGFFSMAGLAGGAWLGFRTTRHWDDRGEVRDAPPALVRRNSDGRWSAGSPGLRPVEDARLGPVLGKGVAATVVGVTF